MHLKSINLSISKSKTRFQERKHPCGTVCAEIAYVLGLLVHGQVGVVLCRKVFLVDCLL